MRNNSFSGYNWYDHANRLQVSVSSSNASKIGRAWNNEAATLLSLANLPCCRLFRQYLLVQISNKSTFYADLVDLLCVTGARRTSIPDFKTVFLPQKMALKQDFYLQKVISILLFLTIFDIISVYICQVPQQFDIWAESCVLWWKVVFIFLAMSGNMRSLYCWLKLWENANGTRVSGGIFKL